MYIPWLPTILVVCFSHSKVRHYYFTQKVFILYTSLLVVSHCFLHFQPFFQNSFPSFWSIFFNEGLLVVSSRVFYLSVSDYFNLISEWQFCWVHNHRLLFSLSTLKMLYHCHLASAVAEERGHRQGNCHSPADVSSMS